jgi:glycosyltransferase involved in cell wall biosynthesis
MTRVHQLVPTFEPGAVGGHILQLCSLLRELGAEGGVYTEHHRFPGQEADDFRSLRTQPGDVLLYHVAIGSVVADFVAERREPLVVDHHNITPTRFFEPWEPGVVHGLAWGRHQLAALAGRAALGIADSGYNESELLELGYRPTAVAPILFDTDSFGRHADPAAEDRLRTDDPVWLFVGRVAPNKAHHDLVKALSVYRRVYEPRARLRIVGAPSSDRYLGALHDLVLALQLDDAVELCGAVGDAELTAHYRTASELVCLSDHEGFCVPLLEAMHHGLPIVAFASTAVPETLGDGGLCLPGKASTTVAAAAHRVHTDGALRSQLVAAGRRRLGELALPVTRRRMADALAPVLA